MLEKLKMALRITTDAYDDELNDLISAALDDLGLAGVQEEVLTASSLSSLIRKAVITYCKMSFGLPEDYDRLKRSYDEQKAQLTTASGYTNWGDACV